MYPSKLQHNGFQAEVRHDGFHACNYLKEIMQIVCTCCDFKKARRGHCICNFQGEQRRMVLVVIFFFFFLGGGGVVVAIFDLVHDVEAIFLLKC